MSTELQIFIAFIILGLGFLYAVVKSVRTNYSEFIKLLKETNSAFNARLNNSFVKLSNDLKESNSTLLQEQRGINSELLESSKELTTEIQSYTKSLVSLRKKNEEAFSINEKFLTDLKKVTFEDFQEINKNIKLHIEKFAKYEELSIHNNSKLADILESIKGIGVLLNESNESVDKFNLLRQKIEDLNSKFTDSSLKMGVLNTNITKLLKNVLEPILQKYSNLVPEFQTEISKLSINFNEKFDESVENLKDVSKSMNEITEKYKEVISGTRRDNVTNEFIDK